MVNTTDVCASSEASGMTDSWWYGYSPAEASVIESAIS